MVARLSRLVSGPRDILVKFTKISQPLIYLDLFSPLLEGSFHIYARLDTIISLRFWHLFLFNAFAIPIDINANYFRYKVIEYLIKKGYNRTEQMLRQESTNVDKDGKPIQVRAEDLGTSKYGRAFKLLDKWIDQSLDIYKVITSTKNDSLSANSPLV